MANKDYTTRQEVENYLLITIDASFYTQIDNWIADIERFIDRMTGRNFKADSVETERVYDGNGTIELLVDDFTTISKLKIDDVEVLAADYYVYPANSERKYRLRLISDYFTSGHQNITVTAKWGYSAAVPEDVKMAATVLVAGIINFSNNAEGEVKTMSIGRYSVTYKDKTEWMDYDRALDILKGYRKQTF